MRTIRRFGFHDCPPVAVDRHDRWPARAHRAGPGHRRSQAARSDHGGSRSLGDLLRLLRGPLRCGRVDLRRARPGRRVLHRVHHGVLAERRQPVHLHDHHGVVQGARHPPAPGAAGRHPARAGLPQRLHRHRGRAARAVRLCVLPLRRDPRLDRGQHAARQGRGRGVPRERRHPAGAQVRPGDRRLPRPPLHGEDRRQADDHADAAGDRGHRLGGPALRGRLDPGDLRHHAGGVPRLHRQRVRADGPAAAVLPARRAGDEAGLPDLRPRGDPRVHRREAVPARPARVPRRAGLAGHQQLGLPRRPHRRAHRDHGGQLGEGPARRTQAGRRVSPDLRSFAALRISGTVGVVRPADIEALVAPGRPALRGNLLLTTLKKPDLETNAAHSALRRVSLDGGDAAWTHGPRDSAPAISPDGRWVAFLRAGEGTGAEGSPQLHVMPADGGDARRLTSLHLGAGEPVWAPDSRRIAFTARVPAAGRYGTADAAGATPEPAAEAPRRITRMDYRIDDVGFLRDRSQRRVVVDALAEELPDPEPLTGDGYDVTGPVWTPDGTRVVFTAPPDWGAAESDYRDVCAISAEGGEPEVVVRGEGYSARPVFAAAGTLFYFGQSFAELHDAAMSGLYTATPEFGSGPAKARRLTDIETVDCETSAGPPAPREGDVLVAVRNRGAVELRAVAVDAADAPQADLPVVYADRTALRSFTLDGTTLAAVIATPDTSGEVVLLRDGTPQVLTDYSKPLRDKGIRPMIELETTAPDGYPVHGWLVVPAGDGPHPVLRVVHGGPFTQQDWAVFDEAQVYAAAGYAVVVGT